MIRKWIVTFGGMGLLPAMPGTFGSLAATLVFLLVWRMSGERTTLVMAGLILLCAVVSALLHKWTIAYFRTPDPRPFVLDEVVGQWMTLLFVPHFAAHPLAYAAVGFFLFRAFDVAKPFPIRQIERLPGFWGVLLDDVMAAIYAGIGMRLLVFVTELAIGTPVT